MNVIVIDDEVGFKITTAMNGTVARKVCRDEKVKAG
jgi:hypothetical protein